MIDLGEKKRNSESQEEIRKDWRKSVKPTEGFMNGERKGKPSKKVGWICQARIIRRRRRKNYSKQFYSAILLRKEELKGKSEEGNERREAGKKYNEDITKGKVKPSLRVHREGRPANNNNIWEVIFGGRNRCSRYENNSPGNWANWNMRTKGKIKI